MFECVLNMRYRLGARSRWLGIDPHPPPLPQKKEKKEKETGQYPTILTEQARSVEGFIAFVWPKRGLFWATKKKIKIKIVSYLTIIPRARMGSESIAHEAEG